MVVYNTVCSECGNKGTEKDNYCPQCGSENPWVEKPKYSFDEEDLPIIFESSISRDNWELWDEFCDSYFGVRGLKGSDIEGLPDNFPRLKYSYFSVYWKITKDLDIKGPYICKENARSND